MHHHVSGSGPPLLLLHPGGQDGRVWERVVPCLQDSCTVITLDRRGHGDNADHHRVQAVNASTLAELNAVQDALRRDEEQTGGEAADIENLLLSLGHRAVTILGVTDGGLLGFRLAARGQVEVTTMIAVETTLVAPTDITLEQILEQADEIGRDLPALGEVLPRVLADNDPEPLVEWAMSEDDLTSVPADVRERMRTILLHNALPSLLTVAWPTSLDTEELTSITSRVLALHGNPRARRANELLPGALPHADVTLSSIPNMLACYPMSMPDDCCRRVLDFLRSGAPAAAPPSPQGG